jgi:DNA-binding transcriptional regulator YdaS (Cro superfamily)
MSNISQSREALDRAIALYPTLKAFADEVGETYQVVQQWRINGVPTDKCYAVEVAAKGVSTRKDFRPDDWERIWPELKNQ